MRRPPLVAGLCLALLVQFAFGLQQSPGRAHSRYTVVPQVVSSLSDIDEVPATVLLQLPVEEDVELTKRLLHNVSEQYESIVRGAYGDTVIGQLVAQNQPFEDALHTLESVLFSPDLVDYAKAAARNDTGHPAATFYEDWNAALQRILNAIPLARSTYVLKEKSAGEKSLLMHLRAVIYRLAPVTPLEEGTDIDVAGVRQAGLDDALRKAFTDSDLTVLVAQLSRRLRPPHKLWMKEPMTFSRLLTRFEKWAAGDRALHAHQEMMLSPAEEKAIGIYRLRKEIESEDELVPGAQTSSRDVMHASRK